MAVNIDGTKNVLATPHLIAMEALWRLKNALIFPALSSMIYGKYFEKAIGRKISVKLPYQAVVSKGRPVVAADINPLVDQTIDIQVGDRWKVVFQWTDEEATMSLRDFTSRYFDAGGEQLAYTYDQAGARELGRSAVTLSGTPGVGFTQDRVHFLRAHAEEIAIPADMNNFIICNPYDGAVISSDFTGGAGASGKFNQDLVGNAIRQRYICLLYTSPSPRDS